MRKHTLALALVATFLGGATAEAKNPPSHCVGLSEPDCGAKFTDCKWHVALVTKSGAPRKAHCALSRGKAASAAAAPVAAPAPVAAAEPAKQ